MIKRITFLFAICLFISRIGQAQDPSFSQYYNTRTYLNPAYAGIDKGLTGSIAYRDQWTKVPGAFKTLFCSIDAQEPYLNSGIGASFYRDVEGEGALTTHIVTLNYAYTLYFKNKKQHLHNLHLGISAAWVTKSIDWNRLIFTDMLDPVFGVVNSTSAIPITQNVGYFDAGFGAIWRTENSIRLGKMRFNNIRSTVGVVLNHLTHQDESLQNIVTRMPMKFTLHAGAEIPVKIYKGVGRQIIWSPQFKFDYQDQIKQWTYGCFAAYDIVYGGVFYSNKQPLVDSRNTNALILQFGFKKQVTKHVNAQIGYSYDANISGLSTRTGGVHEITARVNFDDVILFKDKTNWSKKAIPCYF